MAKKSKKKNTKSEAANTVASDDLLQYAMGVAPIEDIMPEKFWDSPPTSARDFVLYRREARRAIYRIIKYKKMDKPYMDDPRLAEMYDIISAHIDHNNGITWDNFASRWDVHPQDIKKIVLKEHWVKEGGGFDVEMGTHSPTAFTEQKR